MIGDIFNMNEKTNYLQSDNGEFSLFNEISQLVEQSKSLVVSQANSTFTLMFWQIGRIINNSILQNKRADYGKQIVATLSRQLCEKYGKNFEEKNLRCIAVRRTIS